MNISFDYTEMVSLDKQGTVFLNIRISDKWGILTVKKGLLMSPEWNKVHLSNPLRFGNNSVAGDGWELELRETR